MKGADFNRAEELQARRDGAELVKNSGRGQRKGDARKGNLLIDYKFTSSKSFSLNVEAFTKHERDAWGEEREPVIVAIFDEYRGKAIAIVEWEYLKALQAFYEEHNGQA